MMQTEPKARLGLTSKYQQITTAAAQSIVAAVTGKKIYITAIWIYNSHTATNTLKLYSATTEILRYGLAAAPSGVGMNAGSGEPILVTAAAEALNGQTDTGNCELSITYYTEA